MKSQITSEKQNFFNSIIKPQPLQVGDTIGIFTPSWPANVILPNKYQHSLAQIKKAGFNYKEGFLTKSLSSQGYRSSNGKLRAQEFMELLCQPEVKCLMATIGGWNSSSMIPYLDFKQIQKERKIICGYSDITALHLAILQYSNLSTLYGPSLVPIFGEYPNILPYTLDCFLNITNKTSSEKTVLTFPEYYSRQFVDANDENWRKIEENRIYHPNEGWNILCEGKCSGQLIVVNLETLLSLAGTSIFPDMTGKILVLEDEESNLNIQERSLTQLFLMGVFDKISGLLISKHFFIDKEQQQFSFDELLMEIVGNKSYPIVTNFDCGHTFPNLSLPVGTQATVEAFHKTGVVFSLDENFVQIY